ncbi:MAG: DUF1127 domain-containing protein [Acidiferrobacterales bacterium]
MYSTVFKSLDAGYAPVSEAGSSLRQPVRHVHGLIARAFDVLAEWQERARQRRHLMELDDRLLGDIGLTRADVVREASKPFWEV